MDHSTNHKMNHKMNHNHSAVNVASNTVSNIVLECRDVHKEYVDADRSLKVLTGVNLEVTRGEQVAIMGRSGSGKTTLLQMLGSLDTPSQGQVFINGLNLRDINESQRAKVRNQSLGFIYQFHHLLPEFTALENVAMPLLIAKVPIAQVKQRCSELLETVGLKERLHHRPSELSGGERQRVAIARALVNHPDCVLADEPTGNLDDETAEQVFEVMQNLNKTLKISIIVVTHDPDLAAKLDRTLYLHGGCLGTSRSKD